MLIAIVSANFPGFSGLVTKAGYIAEKHDVYTDDGWRLSMIRIYKQGIFDLEPAI
jgi:hypothetical protein